MKTFFKTLGLSATLALVLFAGQLRAQDDAVQAPPDNNNNNNAPTASAPANGAQDDSSVSFQTFYDQLAGEGSWIQTDKYGYVFQPTESDPNWRPYTYGHWVNTDAGMTWVSDEPFGWATYHYGRWVNLDSYGWVWVPGYTWAPAWVSWRQGDDDVGWAPLPPDSAEGIDYYNDDDYYTDAGWGFHIGDDCDVAYGIGPWWYNFCPIAFIGDRDCWRHFRDRGDNFAFIGRTRNVTNLNFRRDGTGRFGHVRADGPSVAALNARARTPIGSARLTSASRLGDAGLRGNRLSVFAPRVDPATAHTARPSSVRGTVANTSVNRGTNINRPLAVNSQLRPAGPTGNQIHAATLAQGNVPANARIATANTRISRPLTQPLTSLRTGTRSNSNMVAGRSRVSAPSASAESRFTGEPVVPHATMSSSAESRFTGGVADSQGFAPSRTNPAFRNSPSFSGGSAYSPGEGYRPSSVFHTSAPTFHSSVPAYHPQQSFRSFAPAPQPHFNGGGGGGGFRGGGGAPAAHSSGGGFGGGARSFSGGGGAAHVSGGGGHVGGGGGGGHGGGAGHR